MRSELILEIAGDLKCQGLLGRVGGMCERVAKLELEVVEIYWEKLL